MRFLVLVKGNAVSESGAPGDEAIFRAMADYHEELVRAGVLLDASGLHPTSRGWRIRYAGGKGSLVDGPFTESKELVASYAFFQVKSMDEAIHWTKRFLEVLGQGECELRPIFEPEDFSTDVFTPEERKREAATRERMRKNAAKGV